jgi:hypothetical protein
VARSVGVAVGWLAVRERLAYLHLPKAAGTSIRAALSSYYDEADTVPWSFDRHMFGDVPDLAVVDRPVFLGDPAEFRRYRYMEGHWSLPTILAGFDPEDVACILREPRSRFLSQYTFWRSWEDAQHEVWHPFDTSLLSRRPLAEYASADRAACISDNLATRLILGPHPLIPADRAIAAADIDAVARDACAALDRIGHVDVIERGEDTYVALEAWFGSPLSRERLNETQLDRGEPVDLDDLVDRPTQALVNDRSAADLQVWHHVIERRGTPHTAARSVADASYSSTVGRIAVRHAAPRPAPVEPEPAPAAPERPPATVRLARLVRRGPRAWVARLRDEIDVRRGRITRP